MRCLGIDYGRKRIGLALSDPTCLIASPLMIIENKGPKKTTAHLWEIIAQNQVEQLVFGLPLHANGDESAMSTEVREFSTAFSVKGMPVDFIDERYTSMEAEELIGNHPRRKELVDKVAASIILQMYLDKRRGGKNESKNHE